MSQGYDDYQRQSDPYQHNNSTRQEDSSRPDIQPSYTYRDPSLSPELAMQSTIMDRRQRFRRLRILIQVGCILLPIVGAWILTSHYAATYNTYQQGSCTISSKDVREVFHKDKHGHVTSRTYYPRLFYEVHTIHGEQASAEGYDGPTARSYSWYSDAQAIIDQYQIGQDVSCWYNPVSPDKAFIMFYGFSSSDSSGIVFWSICDIGIFVLVLYLIFDWYVWRLSALQKRGVVTQGKVMEVKQTRDKRGRIHYHSIIHFQAQEEPDTTRKISVPGDLRVGTVLPVCYDPLFPRYRGKGDWYDIASPGAGIIGMAVLAFIGLIILLVVWLIP